MRNLILQSFFICAMLSAQQTAFGQSKFAVAGEYKFPQEHTFYSDGSGFLNTEITSFSLLFGYTINKYFVASVGASKYNWKMMESNTSQNTFTQLHFQGFGLHIDFKAQAPLNRSESLKLGGAFGGKVPFQTELSAQNFSSTSNVTKPTLQGAYAGLIFSALIKRHLCIEVLPVCLVFHEAKFSTTGFLVNSNVVFKDTHFALGTVRLGVHF